MQTILVTGPTGSGKSTMLLTLAKDHGMVIIDPFVETVKVWQEPDPAICGGVVIDHVRSLEGAKEIVGAAAAWCEPNGVQLWLADICRRDIEMAGIQIPAGAIELRLMRDELGSRDDPAPPIDGQYVGVNRIQALRISRFIAESDWTDTVTDTDA